MRLCPILSGWCFFFLCFHTLGIIIPSDELIFFRGVENTNQYMSFTTVTWANITMLPKSQLGKTWTKRCSFDSLIIFIRWSHILWVMWRFLPFHDWRPRWRWPTFAEPKRLTVPTGHGNRPQSAKFQPWNCCWTKAKKWGWNMMKHDETWWNMIVRQRCGLRWIEHLWNLAANTTT